MLTHILHNSEHLCAFIDQLELTLSQPQRRHLLNLADALLVCETRKTLAALRRQFVAAPDVSNMADCLRISPWTAQDVRQPLGAWMVRWAIQQADRPGVRKVIHVNLDDSLAVKHKDTKHSEGVDWLYDHAESTKRRPHYKNGLTISLVRSQSGASWSPSTCGSTCGPAPSVAFIAAVPRRSGCPLSASFG